jgi:hypothetical protein
MFSLDVSQRPVGGSGKNGEKMGVCKESFFIHSAAPEKSNYLSVNHLSVYEDFFCKETRSMLNRKEIHPRSKAGAYRL